MICKLKGVIDDVFCDGISIDVNGVCYFVYSHSGLIARSNTGDKIEILIHHIFKQEQQILCGFTSKEEIQIFKILIDVQGVGIKSAMSILSKINAQDFVNSIKNHDHSLLCLADGIGKKTAQRIIMELKDKDFSFVKDTRYFSTNENEAILALVSLGYQRDEAYKCVCNAIKSLGGQPDTNTIIVECLKTIAK